MAAARPMIEASLKLLDEIIPVKSTMERENLVGSVYKRSALVNLVAGRAAQARRDLRAMRKAYAQALKVGKAEGSDRLYYPASNCLVADLALATGRRVTLDRDMVAIVTADLDQKQGPDADFWSVAGKTELNGYKSLAGGRLGRNVRQLEREFRNLHERAKPRRMWASVYDDAPVLVLGSYANAYATTPSRPTRGHDKNEVAAAQTLLALLRTFAHPDEAS